MPYDRRVEHLHINPHSPDPTVIHRAARVVLGGGLVAYPTDTLYGLAADPRSAAAVERLFGVKGRVADQAIPLIAADLEQVEREVGVMTVLARRLAAAFWPGPLTLVIHALPGIVTAVHAGTGRVAVRVPNHRVALALAACCGCPVTSTSANLSGQPATGVADDVRVTLGDRIDALLDGGPTPGGAPSTIVDATGDRPLLLRAGIVAWDRVLECE